MGLGSLLFCVLAVQAASIKTSVAKVQTAPSVFVLPSLPVTPLGLTLTQPLASEGLRTSVATPVPALIPSALTLPVQEAVVPAALPSELPVAPRRDEESAEAADYKKTFSKRLRKDWDIDFDGDKAAAYQKLLERSSWAPESMKELLPAAYKLFDSAGIAVRPSRMDRASKEAESILIVPVKGVSRANDLAYHFKERLGVDLEYAPESLGKASAFYMGRDRKIGLPHLGRLDYYLSLLHEARHGHYGRLLLRGQTRLFHFEAHAGWKGLDLNPDVDAGSYGRFMSFEELSTFPKELRQMLSAAEQADTPAKRAALLERVQNYSYNFAAILDTARYVAHHTRNRSRAGSLDVTIVTPEQMRQNGLEEFPGGRWVKLIIARGYAFMPIETQDPRGRLARLFGNKVDPLVWETIDLKLDSLLSLTKESSSLNAELFKSLMAKDYAAAKKTASVLSTLPVKADERWLKDYAALKAGQK